MNPEELKKARNKLKKNKIQNNCEKPTFNMMTEEDLSQFQKEQLDINIEEWLDLIPEYTFKTEYYPLPMELGKLFMEAYETRQKTGKITEEIKEKLKEYANSIQKVIERVKEDSDGVFIKSSSRSAKDSVIYETKFKDNYRTNFLKLENNENNKLISLLITGMALLKTKDAYQMLQLWTQSERIYQDMIVATKFPDRFNEHFAVRKWQDMEVDMEFRAFVYDGHLTAISQYNHFCYFPRLLEMKEKLQNLMVTFWKENLRDKLHKKFPEYVVDFCIVGENYDKVMVIELNPFKYTTDSALFSWEKERKSILTNPEQFEFRLVKSVRSGSKSLISSSWRKVMDEVDEELKNKK
ncbi:cell division cycle protein [Anaeramoeba flamelloides]|uniref:Cell division cycle protein n=1 Tax=Anaeramoeba flamelloides TaxID=1746091 RepID=A0ABQ8ZC91_9EUKA|nr:cell division cycle protein [Anaeramoeba flamelloides]